MASAIASVPAAIEQALALFEPEHRPPDLRIKDGYLDLLDEADPMRRSLAQRTMESGLVPPIYERLWRPFVMRVGMKGPKRRDEEQLAVRMLALSSEDRALDLACGPGNFTRLIAAAAPRGLVVGLDASRPMLSAATRRTASANVAYMRADACVLPFRAASFDAVNCFGALHVFEQPLQALDEMVRVLAPGGRVALMVTCARDSQVSDDGAPVTKYGGVRMFARDEITRALGERGLIDVEQRVTGIAQFVSARKPAG